MVGYYDCLFISFYIEFLINKIHIYMKLDALSGHSPDLPI